MQIDLIDTFLDLMETNSFNRSAERLGVKQSTVSTRVQSLEALLGATLFERSRAGTRPTAAGLNFMTHARALRHEWNEARRSVSGKAETGPRLRFGLQSDLATSHIGEWVQAFLAVLPDASFYVEADFSAQMSDDVLTGINDFAILYTPFPHPDLYYERLGEVAYRMISTHAGSMAEVQPDRLIQANYSPAFDAAQREVLTHPATAPVSSGLSATICSLLRSLGGTSYVLERSGELLVLDGTARFVSDAPPILQPVHSVVHVRRRHVATHRKLLSVMRQQFRSARPPD